jgi:hypothetical protein
MVDVGHGPEKSASFTRSVKDAEIGVRSPYDLVRRVFTFRVATEHEARMPDLRYKGDCATVKMSGMRAWLQSRIQGWPNPSLHRLPECRALLEAAGSGSGLLEAIHFRRITDDAEGWPWEVQVRQLILAADGTKVPTALLEASIKPRYHRVIPKPRRRAVVSAVARTLHYPDGLIDPHVPVGRIVEYLDIRRGWRLIASYGRFRASKT